ncbi:MAG TPA: aldo/keto reductase [Xanthomonadales bacterium]|nr:aldo/keto reductase [Xanthomonadales bacterium]
MPLLKRAIPKSGEQLPVIGVGTSGAFDIDASGSDGVAAKEALTAFVEGGGTVVDSSPMYGRAERAVGDLAESLGLLPKLWIATKIWTDGKAAGQKQLADSHRLLRREKLDLVQVHNLVDTATHVATLRAARDAGTVRYVGLTHYTRGSHEALEREMKKHEVDFIQINYSPLEPEAAERLLPAAADARIAVLVNRPFADGALFGRVKGRALPPVAAELGAASAAQLALKWILANPAVTCVLAGSRKAAHVRDNLAGGAGPLPDAAQRAAIAAWFAG